MDWGYEELQVDYHCLSDLMSQPGDPNAKLLEVKWIVASQNALPAQDALLRDRVHRLQGLPRHESVLLQGGAVAIDEVRFYLTAMDSVGPVRSFHPLVIHFLTDLDTEAAEWLCDMASFSDQQMLGLQ